MLALLFVPIILVIGYSFFDNVLINQHPKWVGLQNYIEVLTDPVFLKSMKNTAIFVVCNVVFHLVIGMTLALMVNAKSLHPAPKAFSAWSICCLGCLMPQSSPFCGNCC